MSKPKFIQIGDVYYDTITLAALCEGVPLTTLRKKIKDTNNDPERLRNELNANRLTLASGEFYKSYVELSEKEDLSLKDIKKYLSAEGKSLKEVTLDELRENCGCKDIIIDSPVVQDNPVIICGKEYRSVRAAAIDLGFSPNGFYQTLYNLGVKEFPNDELDEYVVKRLKLEDKAFDIEGVHYTSYSDIGRAYGIPETLVQRIFNRNKHNPEKIEEELKNCKIYVFKSGNKYLSTHSAIADELGIPVNMVGKLIEQSEQEGVSLKEVSDRYKEKCRKSKHTKDGRSVTIFNKKFSSVMEASKFFNIRRITMHKYLDTYGRDDSIELQNVIRNYFKGKYKIYENATLDNVQYKSIFDAAVKLNKPVAELEKETWNINETAV